MQIETITMLNVWINGKKLNDNVHAGKDAVTRVLLYIADGSVNWCDLSDFSPSLKSVHSL